MTTHNTPDSADRDMADAELQSEIEFEEWEQANVPQGAVYRSERLARLLGEQARRSQTFMQRAENYVMSTRTIVLTTAPAAYDYSYVVDFGPHEVELYPGRLITVRMVTMPTNSVAYQTGRYESGLYFVRIGEVVEDES